MKHEAPCPGCRTVFDFEREEMALDPKRRCPDCWNKAIKRAVRPSLAQCLDRGGNGGLSYEACKHLGHAIIHSWDGYRARVLGKYVYRSIKEAKEALNAWQAKLDAGKRRMARK